MHSQRGIKAIKVATVEEYAGQKHELLRMQEMFCGLRRESQDKVLRLAMELLIEQNGLGIEARKRLTLNNPNKSRLKKWLWIKMEND